MAQSIGVAEYFAGKSVFITGATGFVGQVLVEKLLRSCPDVKTLYLLLRSKKGLSAEERLQSYVNCEVFHRVQAECPKNLHKLRIVSGDIIADQLGISILDQEELQREIQIILHCAASVRFDMFIRDAVQINVNGTLKLLKFAETLKNLEVFLHMSTAYCHDDLHLQEEKLYPAKHRPEDVMNIVQWMDEETLKTIESKLIHPLPNTYSYTKALSEDLVVQFSGKFPIAIARPSIVVCAYQEPLPGWINNLNGPTGLLVAGAKGVFHIMHAVKDIQPDLIPVDVTVNATLILTAITGKERPKDIRVCNITNSGLNSVTWIDTLDRFHEGIQNYPFSTCLWYPKIKYHESWLLYELHALLVHWLPALFIDMLLILFRKKPFMIKVQKRLRNGLNLLAHYITDQWIFKNDYFYSLRNRISKEEREIFFTEYEKIDLNLFVTTYVKGTRLYCCKEPVSTVPRAKRTLKILYYIQLTFKLIFVWCFLRILYYVSMRAFFLLQQNEVTL